MDSPSEVEIEAAAQVQAANNYAVMEDDEWIIDILRRVANLPGHHLGSMMLSALDAFIKGYRMARIDAGLIREGGLLLNFSRWVMQSCGNPTLPGAMESVDPTGRVEPFFRLFDQYLRTHGVPAGLSIKPESD